MIRSLSAAVLALAGVGLLAASPASAASRNTPVGGGYLAVPTAFHSAATTMIVPTVTCAKSSPAREDQLGLFVTIVSSSGTSHPVSVTVDATCSAGRSRYFAAFRGHDLLSVTPGDRVRVSLSGKDAGEFGVDDRTTGEGAGGASGSSGPPPVADRHVLIGEQVVGRAPKAVRATFDNPKVNGNALAHVAHHQQGQTAEVRVTKLEHAAFDIVLQQLPTR